LTGRDSRHILGLSNEDELLVKERVTKMRHWLLQFRNAKGYTQKEVADICGISRSYYADIELGTANASGRAAKLISDALGFDMVLFFVEVGRETRQKKPKSA
jgi:putative transcriptional regulator